MNTIRCPQCNLTNWSTSSFCKRCNLDLTTIHANENEPVAAAAGFGAPTQAANYQTAAQIPPNFQGQNPNYQNAQNHNWNSQNSNRNYSYGTNDAGSQNSHNGISHKAAIISLILGILSFPVVNLFVCMILMILVSLVLGNAGAAIGGFVGLLLIPIAFIKSISTVRKINREPHLFGGKGLAITGIVLSGIAVIVTPILAVTAMPSFMMARRAANEAAAIESIKNIAGAQKQAMSVRGKCDELDKSSLDSELRKGIKSGYIFMLSNDSTGCSLQAFPTVKDGFTKSGNRTFYADSREDWRIRVSSVKGRKAGSSDAPLDMNNPIEFQLEK